MKRICGNCQGAVVHHFETFDVELPVRDERGQPIYEKKYDKQARSFVSVPLTYKQKMRGLGHWSCVNGCPKRRVNVTKRVDSGKEEETRRGSDQMLSRERDIEVRTLGRAQAATA